MLDPSNESRAWLALSCARDGTILQVLRDDLGLTAEAPQGARLTDIVDGGSAAKAERLLGSAAQDESVIGWELNVRANGGARPLSFAAAAGEESLLVLAAPSRGSIAELFDDVAHTNLAVSQALRMLLHEQRTNITAAMRRDNELYEELSRLNNDLINRERELARKSAALERLSAEKSRVVAIAAHDLRNPLTVIASYADLLRLDQAIEGEHRSYLEEITLAARFMMDLVEEMLDSARVESGHVDLDLEDIDLGNAGRHAATTNRLRADRKQISVEFHGPPEPLLVHADPVKLRQIINNLVVNAIKFSPPRTTVTVRVKREGEFAVLEVEDQGIGIVREQIPSIFEPFTTLGPAGTAGEKSTGLGLAIVSQFVKLHGATVEVESEEGKGSLFRVRFPAVR